MTSWKPTLSFLAAITLLLGFQRFMTLSSIFQRCAPQSSSGQPFESICFLHQVDTFAYLSVFVFPELLWYFSLGIQSWTQRATLFHFQTSHIYACPRLNSPSPFLHQKMENLVFSPPVLGIIVTVPRQEPECYSLLLLFPPPPLLSFLRHSSSLILIYNLHRSCHSNLNVFCLIPLNSSVLFSVMEGKNVATLWDCSGYKVR